MPMCPCNGHLSKCVATALSNLHDSKSESAIYGTVMLQAPAIATTNL
jgi:hypothetical protein